MLLEGQQHPKGVLLTNRGINPLAGLHLLVLFNMAPQMEQEHLQRIAASALASVTGGDVPFTPLHDALGLTVEPPKDSAAAAAMPPHITTPMDQAAVLLILRAFALAALGDVTEARKLFTALEAPFVTAALRHEKWVGPYAMYGHAVMLFNTSPDGPQQCRSKLLDMKQRFGSLDFNFVMQMQLRAHLTHHVLAKPAAAEGKTVA